MPLATTVLVAKDRAPERSMLFLHGILGTRANWRGLARKFVDARPGWAAVLVDLREHGDSIGLPGPDTVAQCARDLAGLDAPAPVRGALGHSFGGKVAMVWAGENEASVDALVVVDSSPSARSVESRDGNEAGRVLDVLRRGAALHPHGYASREAFADFVVACGESRGIADWLSMNLAVLPNGNRGLKLDLDRIEELLLDYGRVDTWATIESGKVHGSIDFLVGGRSTVLDDADRRRLEAAASSRPNVRIHTVPEAGHWVHVDAPGRVLEVLANLY